MQKWHYWLSATVCYTKFQFLKYALEFVIMQGTLFQGVNFKVDHLGWESNRADGMEFWRVTYLTTTSPLNLESQGYSTLTPRPLSTLK